MHRLIPLLAMLLLLPGCLQSTQVDSTADAGPPAPDAQSNLVSTPPADADLSPAPPQPAAPSVRFYRVQDPFVAQGPGRFIKGSSSQVHLAGEPFLDEAGIASAKVVPGSRPDVRHVQVWFTDAGAQAISAVTSAHQGEQIAIVVNGEVIAAPQVRGTVNRSAVIAGEFTPQQAESLAAGLNLER